MDADNGADEIERVLPLLQKGLTLQEAGKLDQAEAVYHDVLVQVPGLGDPLHLLGQIALKRGDYDRAANLIAEAIADLPEDIAEPYVNLGHALIGLGKAVEAETSYRRALEIDQSQLAAYVGLARLFNMQNKFESTVSICLASLPKVGQSCEIMLNLGIALRGVNLRHAAETALRAAHAIDQKQKDVLLLLGMLLAEMKRYDEALAFNERACALYPDDGNVAMALGGTLIWLKQQERARDCTRRAVELDPRNARAWAQLGTIERGLGAITEAKECFSRALEIDPELPEALWNVVFTETQGADSCEARRLRTILSRPETPLNERITAGFALGKILDDNDRYDEAFAIFAEANERFRRMKAATGEKFDPAAFMKRIDEVIRQTPAELFDDLQSWGNPSPLPVFVVGMPRSGTTLIEQIIASHPAAHGAGELRAMAEIAMRLAEKYAAKASMAEWDGNEARALADKHVERLTAMGGGALRVVDKLPDNILLAHFIRALFPNAPIVYAKRDARDCGLSNFFQFYTHGNVFAFDLGHIGVRARETERLGRYLGQTIPGPFLKLQYEDLVADLEGQSRRLIEAIGLPWDDRCLDFHKTERTVTTPSSMQVRRPIYTRSVDRWRCYEKHLAPLIAAYQGA